MENINFILLFVGFAGVILIVSKLILSRTSQFENDRRFLNELLKKQINRSLFALGGELT